MQNMMEQKIMKRDSDTAWGIERRKELIIDHWLMSVLVERGIEVIRRNLRGHVHICGVSVRIGIIVLLGVGVCHDCRVCGLLLRLHFGLLLDDSWILGSILGDAFRLDLGS